ncbi:MAG TPA: DsbA family protein, partial [Solirubrobacteraceae bacterium]|nr:DsbA family protein [Solirubrobacteraceae bacterium]
MAGSSTADQAAFYFDLASPESYLVAERILRVLPGPCAWRPVLASELRGGIGFGAWRCAEEREIELSQFERAAARGDLQPVRWPAELPVDSEYALRAATYAAGIGRAVAFAQAAFRQIYAGGSDLSIPDNVLIAAAACEMHPKAVLTAVQLRSVHDALASATQEAATRGVTTVPAIWSAGTVHYGEAGLEAAAAAL